MLMLRVQNRGRETFFLTAQSADGVDVQRIVMISFTSTASNAKEDRSIIATMPASPSSMATTTSCSRWTWMKAAAWDLPERMIFESSIFLALSPTGTIATACCLPRKISGKISAAGPAQCNALGGRAGIRQYHLALASPMIFLTWKPVRTAH